MQIMCIFMATDVGLPAKSANMRQLLRPIEERKSLLLGTGQYYACAGRIPRALAAITAARRLFTANF